MDTGPVLDSTAMPQEMPEEPRHRMFASVYHRYAARDTVAVDSEQQWPGMFRDKLPSFDIDEYHFQVGVEKQTPRQLSWTQIKALPSFNETRQLVSKTGWAYRGHWRGLTFQTLMSLFSTPHLYEWVKLESMTGEIMLVDRQSLMQWRIMMECDGLPLTALHGGPLWVHNFDFYAEFGFPHLKSMTLLQSGQFQTIHPKHHQGYSLDNARIDAGDYYLIHEDKVMPLGHLGRKL